MGSNTKINRPLKVETPAGSLSSRELLQEIETMQMMGFSGTANFFIRIFQENWGALPKLSTASTSVWQADREIGQGLYT